MTDLKTCTFKTTIEIYRYNCVAFFANKVAIHLVKTTLFAFLANWHLGITNGQRY